AASWRLLGLQGRRHREALIGWPSGSPYTLRDGPPHPDLETTSVPAQVPAVVAYAGKRRLGLPAHDAPATEPSVQQADVLLAVRWPTRIVRPERRLHVVPFHRSLYAYMRASGLTHYTTGDRLLQPATQA